MVIVVLMKEQIHEQIKEALNSLGIEGMDFVVDHPTDKNTDADYFSNVALVAAKVLERSPRDIAEQCLTELEDKIDRVDSIEVAGPGFLNFKLNRDFFTEKITTVLEAGENWGKNNSLEGKRIMVEYTQPNPLKVFHIGHLMSNAIGEAISRIVEANGAEVFRANYQGDVGLHIGKALYGMQALGYDGTDVSKVGEAYAYGNTKYEEDEEAKAEIIALTKKAYEKDPEIMDLYATGREVSLKHFEKIYERVGSKFDRLFFESETWEKGKEIVDANTGDIFEASDGAVIYRGEQDGLHTRVFVNSEGVTTYEAKDIGLAFMKKDAWKFDECIYVTAVEQDQYFKVIFAVLGKIDSWFKGRLSNIAHGMMTLPDGKMSSRTGNVITGESMLNEAYEAALERMKENNKTDDPAVADMVGVAALKYTILHQSLHKNTIYDLDRAVSFEGDSGPYLQYTHARIVSVLKKAAEANVKPGLENAPTKPYEIETLIYQFPEVVKEAWEERAPHDIATYLIELAGEFNSFYAQEKIADPNDEFAPYKAAVADAVRITLKNGLWMLGIKAPEAM